MLTDTVVAVPSSQGVHGQASRLQAIWPRSLSGGSKRDWYPRLSRGEPPHCAVTEAS